MNNQPHTILSREELRSFNAAWRQSTYKPAAARAFLLQAVIRGRDPLRGFSPVTNACKLANGQAPRGSYAHALRSLSYYLATNLKLVWPEFFDGSVISPARRLEIEQALSHLLAQLPKE